MEKIDTIYDDIKQLRIQGATNVAITVLDTLQQTLHNTPNISADELHEIGIRLSFARPTEPLAQNAVRYIFKDTNIAANIAHYKTCIEDGKKSIPQHGESVLKDGGVYLTLCHSSTTVALFANGRKHGAIFSLFVAETRPLYQGRTTAKELLTAGFDDVTMVIDDVAVSIVEGRKGAVDAIFIGADMLNANGFANKIGSLALSMAAEIRSIPVYVVTTLLKFDPRTYDPSLIEQRDPSEIWKDAPKGLKFYAPAFDYVPYRPHIHIISEAGITQSNDIRYTATNFYPFLQHI